MNKIINNHINLLKIINEKYKIKYSHTRYLESDYQTVIHILTIKKLIKFNYEAKVKWKKDNGKREIKLFQNTLSDYIIFSYENSKMKLNLVQSSAYIYDDTKQSYHSQKKYTPSYKMLNYFSVDSKIEIQNIKQLLKILDYFCVE